MNKAIKKQILAKIEEFDTIIISRHIRPDGDAVGSTMGLYEILRATYPEKRIFLDNEDYSNYVAFLGDEGAHPTDDDYKNALIIVVDTGTIDRVSNKRVQNGRFLIKIDHHIDKKPYGDLSWVEEERSAAAEMIADFYETFRDKLVLTEKAATCLYAGIVTDSGRFRYQGTCGDTLRAAATLLDRGIDIERLYASLYMDDFSVMQFDADMTKRIKRTENGVAYLTISKTLRRRRRISQEDASNTVSLMDGIRGSLIWLAFIENDDGSIRVRLRSRFVPVEELAGRYHGGGHANASGATVYSQEEAEALIADADALLGQFRAANPDLF